MNHEKPPFCAGMGHTYLCAMCLSCLSGNAAFSTLLQDSGSGGYEHHGTLRDLLRSVAGCCFMCCEFWQSLPENARCALEGDDRCLQSRGQDGSAIVQCRLSPVPNIETSYGWPQGAHFLDLFVNPWSKLGPIAEVLKLLGYRQWHSSRCVAVPSSGK